jgi:hypothetical protein
MDRSIESSTTIRVTFARACDVLMDNPGAVFGDADMVRDGRARRFHTELSVDLGAGASVHQEVSLQLDAPRSTETTLVLPLTWRATGRQRLLPTFDGELEITEARKATGLRLSGMYTLPPSVVGRLGSGVVARLAGRSLDALVERLASRLETEVQRRLDLDGRNRDRIPSASPIFNHPEIYVG